MTNPGPLVRSAPSVRTNSPAPIKSTSASAIWAVTRTLRMRSPVPIFAVSSFSASDGCSRAACTAGAMPNAIVVTTAVASAKENTRTLTSALKSTAATVCGRNEIRTRMTAGATSMPTTAPPTATNALCTSSARATRRREAPSASFSAVSRRRA